MNLGGTTSYRELDGCRKHGGWVHGAPRSHRSVRYLAACAPKQTPKQWAFENSVTALSATVFEERTEISTKNITDDGNSQTIIAMRNNLK